MTRWSYRAGIVLWFVMLLIPLYILLSFLHPGKPSEGVLVNVTHTGNTVRIRGNNPVELSMQISRTKFPGSGYHSQPNFIVISDSNPLSALPTASLLAPPFRSVLLISRSVGDMDKIMGEIKRLSPVGINGYQVITVGDLPRDYFDTFTKEGLSYRILSGKDPVELSAKISEFRNSLLGFGSKTVLAADIKDWKPLLPGLAWSTRTGDSIFFLRENQVPSELKHIADQEHNKLRILFFGQLDEKLEEKLDKLGEVDIISHPDPAVQSARFAGYYSPPAGPGWYNRASRGNGSFNTILTDDRWYNALLGASLNSSDKFGPLLITAGDRLSPAVENLLWSRKPRFWVTPAEGPYNHTWVIGDSISYSVQARVDYINEIQHYFTLGKQGLSGLEALLLAHILTCVFGSLWTGIHVHMRKPGMFWGTRIMWPLLVSVTGIVGLAVYILSYKSRKPVYMDDGKIAWVRPVWNQAAFATASGLAFGAALMAAFDFFWYAGGMPLLQLQGPFFWIGNPMVIQMILSYIVALTINLLLFQSVITSRKKDIPYIQALNRTLLPVFISMTAVSLGMIPVMWWLQMKYLPSMPEPDTILWWGTLLVSILAGALLSFIANWEMVRLNLKEGNG